MAKYPIFVEDFNGRSLCVSAEPFWKVSELKAVLQGLTGIRAEEVVLAGPRYLADEPSSSACTLEELGIAANTNLHLTARLRGGKGGFGSLLRGSAKSTATDNEDACRDLSGRRLRVVNAEKKLKDWQLVERQRKAQIKAAKEQKDQQKAENRKNITEEQLDAIRKEQSSVANSLAKAMQSSQPTSSKRPAGPLSEQPPKKKRFRGESDEEESDSDLDDSDIEEPTSQTNAKESRDVTSDGQEKPAAKASAVISKSGTVDSVSVQLPDRIITVS